MSTEELKTQMTDEERLELAAKLDHDLEKFIDSLEKKRYTEGWPEDRWEEACTITLFKALDIYLTEDLYPSRKWINIRSS